MSIALKYKDKNFAAFQAAVMQPSGIKMEQVHKDFEIEENDLKTVKIYLDNLATTGPPKVGPTVTQLVLFVGLIVLLILALLDLMFFHVIRFRMVHVLILLITLGLLTKMIATAAVDLGRQKIMPPINPSSFHIKFMPVPIALIASIATILPSSKKSAGIPPMQLCMNCHVLVREGSHSGKFEISKVIEANETNKPVEWIRIHRFFLILYFSAMHSMWASPRWIAKNAMDQLLK